MALVVPSHAQYTFGGSTTSLGGGCYRLTPASTSQAGYFYQDAPLNLNEAFDLKFSVYLGTLNGGADGIMFILRDSLGTPYIGTNGGFMGFDVFTSNALGVEMDTYNNGGNNDPNADHIGILKNGSVIHGSASSLAGPVQASAANADIEDGQYHTFNIRWDPATEDLEVYFDCNIRLQYTGNLVDSIFNGDTLVHWGFLGTTGGAANDQRFCFTQPIDSFVVALHDVAICKGDTAQLNAGLNNVSYLWTPPLGLSATNIYNPQAYPSVTTEYYVRETYQCDTLRDTVVVEIIPPNFNISALITNASCKNVCDGEIDLSISGGTGAYVYDWSSGSSSEDLDSLCDGTYYVTVQDTVQTSPNYLCYKRDTFTITEPLFLITQIVNATKTSCPGVYSCDAGALATVNGGTPPYQYLWSTGETSNQANALCPDSNWVTVTDANGCEATDGVDIAMPDSIVTTAFGDTMICISQAAAIAATSIGGTPPFSYVWRSASLSGPVVSVASNDIVLPQVTTAYFVKSFDANGCTGDTAEVLVAVRPPLDMEFIAEDTICPYDTIDIEVVGIGGDSIYTFAWEAGGIGPTLTVSPDLSTYYRVTVSDFCGTPPFVDSVRVQVGGYRDINPSIRVEDDSLCRGESVYLIASARGGHNGPDEYIYTWEHTADQNQVQFVQPAQTTKYVVHIQDLCLSKPGRDTLIVYVGDVHMPEVEIHPPVACKETDVLFRIDEYHGEYNYTWQVDEKDYFLDYTFDSLVYRLNEPGCYFFDLAITTDFGCFARKRFDCAVSIQQAPVADFKHFPEDPSSLEPFVTFTNTSEATGDFYWTINNWDTIANMPVMTREFRETAEPQVVTLFVSTESGCTDSVSHTLNYFVDNAVHYPNSFTPNGDGLNDVFLIEAEGIQHQGFDLVIYDRWGQQLFRSTRLEHGWDGRTPDGSFVQMGVYFFRLKYRDRHNIERLLSGQINVGVIGERNGLK